MSNPSLKEQLEALSLTSSKNSNEKRKNSKRTPVNSQKNSPIKKTKPSWLEQAQYGVELLKVYYPDCFKENKEIKPLKIGIKQDLIKELSKRNDIVVADKACMVSSLTYYVNSISYYRSVVEGASRIDLTGQAEGKVTNEEAHYSAEKCKAKQQKRKQSKSDEITSCN